MWSKTEDENIKIYLKGSIIVMVCPKCNSENVLVQSEQVSSKTKGKSMGCLYTIMRWTLIICTCGLWLLIGRRKETQKTKIKNKTVAVCQNCGHKWYV